MLLRTAGRRPFTAEDGAGGPAWSIDDDDDDDDDENDEGNGADPSSATSSSNIPSPEKTSLPGAPPRPAKDDSMTLRAGC